MIQNKQVKGYEGLYELTHDFKVKSVKRKNRLNDKYLKQNISNMGYIFYNLCKNGFSKTVYLHKIIADLYLDNPLGLTIVDHIDGNKQNNNVENLRWCSQRENIHYYTSKRESKSNNYVGVFRRWDNKKWVAKIYINNKQKYIGSFDSEQEAYDAYEKYQSLES
jgi:hypothetical protein